MNFDKAFEHVIGVEGGYSNHPNDKGGPTNYGITLGALKKYLERDDITALDVKNMTLETAKSVYYWNYWDKWKLDDVESELKSTMMFDQCVNWGIGKSIIKRVQRIVGVDADGVIGPKTLKAINTMDDIEFGKEYAFNAQDRYCRLVQANRSQVVFIAGWINRTQKLVGLVIDAAVQNRDKKKAVHRVAGAEKTVKEDAKHDPC